MALLLIFQTGAAWERVVKAKRNLGSLLVLYLFPMMLLVAAAEGFRLVEWGEPQAGIVHRIHKFTAGQMVIYETTQSLLLLLVIVVCGILIKILAENFHGRYTYNQSFTMVIYALSPMFLLRLMDAVPAIIPWAAWGIGIVLTIKVLHQGVWFVMQPAPPNAFALYFMSSLLLVAGTGLVRFVTAWYLAGRIPAAENFISHLTTHLPF
ncbi:MAG: YIP1 family protein [Verrucomicrobiota bacterium]